MSDPRFACQESRTGRVYVNPAFAGAVEALSLSRFAEAMRLVGGETVDENRKRSVVRLEWRGRRFFLKRFTRPPAKDALARWFRLGGAGTHARQEWDAIRALGAAGIGAPEVAAVGEEAGWGLRRRSFLLTAELEGKIPLDRWLADPEARPASPADRRALAEALARLVRSMHDQGITHPDLYSWHVFCARRDGAWSFALLDLHRARRKARISLFDAVRDLTGLHLTVPPAAASQSDRFRFLRAYFGGRLGTPARRLARKIGLRAARIGKRAKFAASRGARKDGAAEGAPDAKTFRTWRNP